MNNKKILFISHIASRSGAPILALNLAKALQDTYSLETDFVFKMKGELDSEFAKLGKVTILQKPIGSFFLRILFKITKKSDFIYRLRRTSFSDYSLIIANTITNGDILPIIRKSYAGKIISYIHELKLATEFLTTSETIESVKTNSDLFFVPGLAVKKHLIYNCKFPAERIRILPYYIPQIHLNKTKKDKKFDFVVGGSGDIELRKGTDIFVRVALYFHDIHPTLPIQFIWKGGNPTSLEYKFLSEDIVRLGIESNCTFMSNSSDMNSFFNLIDLFVLTSREDPYPLVVLEAANAEVPSICFENAGGASEFISGVGKTVDYLDVKSLSNAILHYYYNPDEMKKDGARAKDKLVKLHQNKEEITNIVYREM